MLRGEIGDGHGRIFLGVILFLLLLSPTPPLPLRTQSLLNEDKRRYMSSTKGEHRLKKRVSTIDGIVSNETDLFSPCVIVFVAVFILPIVSRIEISLPKCSNRFSISIRTKRYPVLNPSPRDTFRKRTLCRSRMSIDTCDVPIETRSNFAILRNAHIQGTVNTS